MKAAVCMLGLAVAWSALVAADTAHRVDQPSGPATNQTQRTESPPPEAEKEQNEKDDDTGAPEAPPPPPRPAFTPKERIPVDQAVDFPVDI